MKKQILNELTFLDIEGKLSENEEALQNLRFQKALQQLENPIQINHLKKEIAQLKTIRKEFDLGIRTIKENR
jgi:large subunit ribosomal protein L29